MNITVSHKLQLGIKHSNRSTRKHLAVTYEINENIFVYNSNICKTRITLCIVTHLKVSTVLIISQYIVLGLTAREQKQ